ncbi:MAG: N-6 DNA methylase, partial [Ktedonobacteraceae bacterium]
MDSKAPRKRKAKPQPDTIIQLVLAPHPHRNQQLFSDHYLNVIGPARTDWQMLTTEAALVLHDLQGIFADYTPSDKEAQAEDDWIKPVLRRLGHTFEVQPSLETPDGTKTPDYILYRDQSALTANKGKKLTDTLVANRAFAVGDAKYWDRPLDVSLKRTGGDPFTNKNPSYQIAFYMQHSGLSWGILTNGRLWRLYHKETAHKLDRFYEVNLPELVQAGDVNAFLYFYAFFRREAFDAGDLSVEKLLQASVDYARGVGDSLKRQVYEALRHVAQGFLDYRANTFQPDPETLKAIYDHSLIVLYRLLFIFYAEARDLLPVQNNRGYGESYSLDNIKKSVQENLNTQRPVLPYTGLLWPRLEALFGIINEGSTPLNVVTFNGGLFDPERYPFLERYAVGDQHLQQAIDKLARVDGQFVDYRDLAERHLGTIYEGLLEFHLEQADSLESGWTVDLKTAKGERKATGSYYTPDYIVKYMVEETLGPVLREAVAHAASEQEKIQAVLNIKVLDPAMGSGHFPVEATEYIARFLVEHIDHTDTDGEPELAYWRRRVAQACIYGLDANPLAVDLAKLSLWLATVAKDRPLSFLDHHLRCGNSLTGAQLADLKLGEKKHGKKARATHNAAAVQPMLFDEENLRQAMTTAVDLMWLIENNPAQTIDQVKAQEQIYKDLRQKLTDKYSRLAHVVSATHFGVTIDATHWTSLADYATGRSTIAVPQFEDWLQSADVAARAYRFFHWELEFPEVFFDRYGQPKGSAAGFDAVLGNPPYVRQEELGPFKAYFAATYSETYDGMADLYVYFYQQGLRLTRAGGRMSYIVTNKWMRAGYGQPLRTYFAQEGALERIIDFGHAPIFEDAEVFPCILVLKKPEPQVEQAQVQERQVQVLNFPRAELNRVIKQQASLGSYVQEHSQSLAQSYFSSAAWHLDT